MTDTTATPKKHPGYNPVPCRDPEVMAQLRAKAHESQRRKREAQQTARAGRPDLHPLTQGEWIDLYLMPGWSEMWRRYLVKTKADLERHYAPIKSEAPQYAAMTWRLAVQMTLAAMLDVQAGDGPRSDDTPPHPRPDLIFEQRMKVEKAILGYVQQLQRYTESESHEVIVRSDERRTALETVVLIADRVLEAVQRQRFLEALMAIVERRDTMDPAKIAALLPAGDVIEGDVVAETPAI